MIPPSKSNNATQSSFIHCSFFAQHDVVNDMMNSLINCSKGHDHFIRIAFNYITRGDERFGR